MENLIFNELELSSETQKGISAMGFEEATPIQSKAIPHILAGRDVLGQAQTGTGKTCAFGIPAIEMVDVKVAGVQVMILCPTRELAIQVSEELKSVSQFKRGVKILPIYGGQSIDRQIMGLKNRPQIIVGTPGRVMDHMRRRTLKLENLKMMILDEADEMLNMGFREDIDIVLEGLPEERQTLLFSATMAPEILELTRLYQKDPVQIKTVHRELTIPQIEQYYLEVREQSKMELLCRLVDAKNLKLALVFCNTKKKVDEVTASLQTRGYSAEALHGDMKQSERDRVMNKFRKGMIELLVATDVAARGIDVNDIEAVFNYDIPNDEEYYVHRIGRTGRAGKAGISYSFVFGRDIFKIKDIQRYTKSEILPMKPPTISDVEEVKLDAAINEVLDTVKAQNYSKYMPVIEQILSNADDLTSIEVAAALFSMAFDELDSRNYEVSDLDDPKQQYSKEGMVRLFMNIGMMDRVLPKSIVKEIASKSSMPGKLIGAIDIHKNFTFVEVPAEYAEEIMYAMRNFTHKGRKVIMEKASKRQRPKSSAAATRIKNRGNKRG